MSKNAPPTILNAGYRSTNYWVVSAGAARILVDIGWPGTMGTMRAMLKRMDIPLGEIRFALATHYHIDHTGLAEEFKREGIPLLVLETQVGAIPVMKTRTKSGDNCVEIAPDNNVVIPFRESRGLLAGIGISGEILHTPGHSDDSVSLLLDDGSAFTGDLPPEEFCADNPLASASWRLLRERGAVRVYPAHGPMRSIEPTPAG
jgi:ribonuclease/clavin/mitogillin